MKDKKLFISTLENLGDGGANYDIRKAYLRSKNSGKSLLDFNDLIWEKDVEQIATILRENGVEEFTISCRSTNLIDCLAIFEKFNWKMNGIIEINTGWERVDGTQETIPALKMKLC